MEAIMWNKSTWINEVDATRLKNKYSELLSLSGFDILNFIEHNFEPQGYTALWLLGESHLAIHTFPEHNKTYLEITSCNQQYYEYFIANIDY